MWIFKKVADLQIFLQNEKSAGRTLGFAPTMGALHAGHLRLIRLANERCGCSVASIFVNPTQFNDPKDLEKYPRTPGRDIALLESAGCKVLFMPAVEEIYPPGRDLTLKMDFRQLAEVMEGKFRPGHFAGMATVVNRLLDIVRPDELVMGQKDFQQLTIVRDMLRQQKSKVELVMCPTEREPDGLAMSSRNVRLSPVLRAVAPVIFQTLNWAKNNFVKMQAGDIQSLAMERLTAAGLQPEYFEIVDGLSLLPVERYSDSDFVVACVAAFAGEVRLIDNLQLKN